MSASYVHVCTKCGKDCREVPARNPRANPVSSCCRAPCDSFSRGKLFDERCLELARHFYPDAPPESLARLAEQIQDTCEDFTDG